MTDLRADHTPEAIRTRIAAATQHSYIGDGVLGAIDGTVTTFAIVAGATGAQQNTAQPSPMAAEPMARIRRIFDRISRPWRGSQARVDGTRTASLYSAPSKPAAISGPTAR